MVARGGVGNPKLIERLSSYFEEKGEYSAMMILRGIAPKFFLHQKYHICHLKR